MSLLASVHSNAASIATGPLSASCITFLPPYASIWKISYALVCGGLMVLKRHYALSSSAIHSALCLLYWVKVPGLIPEDDIIKMFNDKKKRIEERETVKKIVARAGEDNEAINLESNESSSDANSDDIYVLSLIAEMASIYPWVPAFLPNLRLGPVGMVTRAELYKAPKDLDSFLISLRDKIHRLMRGVPAFNTRAQLSFILHAYLIRVFGDMPAIAKLMHMKGHNGFCPCCACLISGVRNSAPGTRQPYYTPLHRHDGSSLDPCTLPLWTHEQFIRQAAQVSQAPTDTDEEARSKEYGINGIPVFASISSLSFPDSFPHNFMHLAFHNVLYTLINLWTVDYKGLDIGHEDYKLRPSVIEAIGKACVKSGDTTPLSFGAHVPNLDTECHYYTIESWMLFATTLGPVLHNRFSKAVYFDHFVQLVKLFNICLLLSIPSSVVENKLKPGFADWVHTYEKLYYQYKPKRLPVCTLPIHGLLHLADEILKADAQDEADCGHLVPDYPGIRVLKPRRTGPVDCALEKAIRNHLLRTFALTDSEARQAIPQAIVKWAQIRYLNGGDTLNVAEMHIHHKKNKSRNATFIKFTLEVNRNERFKNKPVELERRAAYGQLLNILEVEADIACEGKKTLLIAVIWPCKLKWLNKLNMPYYYDGAFRPVVAIDVDDLSCLVTHIADQQPNKPLQWALYEQLNVMGLELDPEEE
ncbi:hypothetical protein V5O48_010032 [Marasmius crinis-equi]|uniref:Transposase family Tnp2 protein n=1 Tax=Marasmius crinis-equi TaxID=585013 RepID=A0ABR3F9L4_9AGAR